MAVVDVLSGRATLDISSFLSSLTQLQAAATRAPAAIDTALAGAGKGASFTTSLTSTASAATKVETTMASAGRSVKDFGTGLAGADKSLGAFQASLNNVVKAGGDIANLGVQFGLLGGIVSGVMVAAVNAASQFDFWTTKAEAATNANQQLTASMVGMPNGEFQAAIEGVANAVGTIKPQDVAQAMYYWTSATGQTIKSQQDLAAASEQVKAIMQASTIAGQDQATTVRGVAQVLGEFGLDVSNTAHVVQTMTLATQQSDVEWTDLIASFKFVGPLAQSMGMTFNQVTADLSVLADAGIRGTQAGRGLGQIFTSLNKPSAAANQELQQLLITNQGLSGSWQDLVFKGGQFIGLNDTITNGVITQKGFIGLLHDALQQMSAAQANATLAQLSSQNGTRALIPLVEAYKDGVGDATDSNNKFAASQTNLQAEFDNSAKTAQAFNTEWDKISQTIAVQWGSVMDRLSEAFMAFGKLAEQALLPTMNQIANAVEGILNWVSQNQQLASTIIKVVAAVSGLSAIIGGFLLVLGRIVAGAADLQLAFKAMVTVVGTLLDIFGPFIPLLLAARVAIAAFARYAQSVPQLAAGFADLGKSISDMGSVAVTVLGGFIKLIQDLFKGDYQAAWNDAVNIVSVAAAGIGAVFSNLGYLVQYGVNQFINWLNTTFHGLGTDFEQWGENIMGAFANGFTNAISSAVIPAINGVIQIISNFLEGHSPAKEGPLSEIDTWGQKIMEAYVGGMKNANMQAVVDAGTMIADALKAQFTALGKDADWSGYTQQFQALRDQVQQIVQDYQNGQQVGQDMWNGIDAALGQYAKDLQAVITAQEQVNQLQDQANKVQAEIDTDNAKLLPYQQQQADLQGKIDQNNFKKDAAQLQVNNLEQQKEPDQNQLDDIQAQKDLNDAQKDKLQAQKDALQQQIDEEEWAVQPIKDQIDQNNILSGLLKDKVSTLDDQKTVIDETIASINRQYQLEQQSLQDTIALLKDKLDQQKAINDLANQPLTDAANKAKDQLDTLKEKFQLQEEPLQQQIDMMKAAGDSAGAAALQKQLTQLQDLHKAQLDPLQLAYDKANTALSQQQRSQSEALMPLQAQYDQASGTAAVNDATQKLATEQQVDSLTAQKNAIVDQQTALNDQIRAYDATNRNLQQQVLLKTENEQQLKDQQQALSLQISAIDLQNSNLQLKTDALNLAIKGIDKLEKPFQDIIKAMDLANQNLQHQIQAISLFQMKPIQLDIADLQKALNDINLALKVAQENLTGAKTQYQLDIQVEQAQQQEANQNNKATTNPADNMPPGPPSNANVGNYNTPDSVAKTLAGLDWSKIFHIDNPFGDLSKNVKDASDQFKKTIGDLTNFRKTLNSLGIGAASTATGAAANISRVNPLIAGALGYQLRGLLPKLPGVGAKAGKMFGGLKDVAGDLASYIGENLLGTYGASFGAQDIATRGFVPGSTASYIPEKFIPGRTLPDQIVPEQRIPGRTIRGRRVGAYTAADQEIPERLMPDLNIPDQVIPERKVPLRRIRGRIIQAYTTPSGRNMPERIMPDQIVPEQIIPEQTIPARSVKGRRVSAHQRRGASFKERMLPDQEVPEQIIPERRIPGRIIADRTIPGHFGPDTFLKDEEGSGLRGLLSGRFPSLKMAENPLDAILKNLGHGSLGDVFGDLLHRVPGLGKAGDAFGGLGKAFGSFADSGVGKVLGDVVGKLLELSKGGVGKAFEAIGGAIAKIKDAAGPAISIFEKFIGIFTKIPLLGQLFKALPIIGDILMLVQVIQTARNAWETNWNGIRDALKNAWAEIHPIFEEIGAVWGSNAGFGDKVGIIGQLLAKAFQDLAKNLQPVVQKTFDQIRAKVEDFFKNLGPTLSSFWTKYGQFWVIAAGTMFGNLVGGLVNFILTNAVPWALQLIGGFLHVVDGFVQGLDKGLTSKGGGSSPLADWFGKAMEGLVAFIVANGPTWAGNIGQGLLAVLTAAFELLRDLAKLLLDIFLALGGVIVTALTAGFMAMWTPFTQWVGNQFNNLGTTIKGVWNNITAGVGQFFNDFGQTIHDAITGIVTWITTTWNALYDIVIGPWKRIEVDILIPVFAVRDFLQDTITRILGWIKTNWWLLIDIIGGPLGVILTNVITHWSQIQQAIQTAITAITGILTPWITAIQNDITAFSTAVQGFFTAMWTAISGTVTQWINTITTNLRQWIALREQDFSNFMKSVEGTFDAIKNAIIAKVTDITDAGLKWVTGLVTAIMDILKVFWDQQIKPIFDQIGTAIQHFADVGTDFYKNIQTFASNLIAAIVDGLKDLGKHFLDALNEGWQSAISNFHPSIPNIFGGGSSGSSSSSGSGGGPQTFSNQPQNVQDAYNNVYGKANAPAQWQKDHEAQLAKQGSGGGWAPGADNGTSTQIGQDMLAQGTGYLGSQAFDMMCEAWVETVFGQATGQDKPNWGATALDAWNSWMAKGMAVPGYPTAPGQLVYFNWAGDGHVGIYEGGGRFISALDNGVQEMTIDDYLKYNADAGASLLGYVPAYAKGTDSASGGLSLVGEDGAELVNLPRGSRVSPNRNLGNALETALSSVLTGLESTLQSLFTSLAHSFDTLAASLVGLSNQPRQITNNYNVYLNVDTAYMQSEDDAKQWAGFLNQLRYQSGNS